jgi:anti-sigma factor RsiW
MSAHTEGPRVEEPSRDDEHALVGAYTLNAVDERERAEFEVHLAGCPLCSADVPAFREVLARLAVDARATPPGDLVGRTLTRARLIPQERRARGVFTRLFRRR